MTMTQEIKLTTDQMKLMSLFQNITKATARDCIDIAVKIILEMSYQTEENEKKKVISRLDETFVQLSTENQFANHFSKFSNRQLRELTATSADIRHIALKVAKAIAGVK